MTSLNYLSSQFLCLEKELLKRRIGILDCAFWIISWNGNKRSEEIWSGSLGVAWLTPLRETLFTFKILPNALCT